MNGLAQSFPNPGNLQYRLLTSMEGKPSDNDVLSSDQKQHLAEASLSNWILRHSKCMLIAALIVLLVVFNASLITDAKIGSRGTDAVTNLMIACNLSRYNRFSESDKLPLLPANSREPVPILALATQLTLLSNNNSNFTCTDFLEDGTASRNLKAINILWVFVGLTGTALLTLEFTNKYSLAALSVVLAGYMYYPNHVDTLYTEAAAASLMVMASLFLVRYVQTRKTADIFIAGIFCGLTALTKAMDCAK